MNETTAGKGQRLLIYNQSGYWICESDDVLLWHNQEPGEKLSRLELPSPAWELETQQLFWWGGVQRLEDMTETAMATQK